MEDKYIYDKIDELASIQNARHESYSSQFLLVKRSLTFFTIAFTVALILSVSLFVSLENKSQERHNELYNQILMIKRMIIEEQQNKYNEKVNDMKVLVIKPHSGYEKGEEYDIVNESSLNHRLSHGLVQLPKSKPTPAPKKTSTKKTKKVEENDDSKSA